MVGRNCRFLQVPFDQTQEAEHPSTRKGGKGKEERGTKEESTAAQPNRKRRRQPPSLSGSGPGTRTPETEAARKRMRKALATNTELQLEVVNYTKSGRQFVNILTMIPIRWHSTEYNYCVGLLCEKVGVEEEMKGRKGVLVDNEDEIGEDWKGMRSGNGEFVRCGVA